MATYTENYQLHQWVPEDDFLRTDFNTDFQKIDAALAAVKALAEGKAGPDDLAELETLINGKTAVVSGSYAGNGSTKSVTLGFQPRAVVVSNSMGAHLFTPYHSSEYGGVTGTGFNVYERAGANFTANTSGKSYGYAAFR